jgi:UTP--glucose-1-phosphate uridylyltransferase
MTGHGVLTAVIPAAGRGTRLLPATKMVPKELLPVAGRPMIDYAIEEAFASGIKRIVLVSSAEKTVIEEHLQRVAGLRSAEVIIVRQPSPNGLGHAIGCVREVVDGRSFAVLLPDTLFAAETPVLAQMLAAMPEASACLLATQAVGTEMVRRCGILGVTPEGAGDGLLRVTSLVEKPALRQAPSRYALLGRYILTPEIFEYIARTPPDDSGEVQLTDSLRLFAGREPVYALPVTGECYDAGDTRGYLVANAAFGLRERRQRTPV